MSRSLHTISRLAEGQWLWRRLFVYVVTAGLWSLLLIVVRATPPSGLPGVAERLMGLLGLVMILYLVAPSAQQIVVMLASLRAGGRVSSQDGGQP